MLPTATLGNDPAIKVRWSVDRQTSAPAKKPFWAEAANKVAGEVLRIIQLHADGRHVFLLEREVSLEGNGPGMGIGL